MKQWNEHEQKQKGMRGRMLSLMLFILFLPALLVGCAREETDLYAVSEEFIGLLWNVDYREFRADETTEFAKKYYESAYLEDYLQDTEKTRASATQRMTNLFPGHYGVKTREPGRKPLMGRSIRSNRYGQEFRFSIFSPRILR